LWQRFFVQMVVWRKAAHHFGVSIKAQPINGHETGSCFCGPLLLSPCSSPLALHLPKGNPLLFPTTSQEKENGAQAPSRGELGLALGRRRLQHGHRQHRSDEDANAKISKTLYTGGGRARARLAFRGRSRPIHHDIGLRIGKTGATKPSAPRERKRGIKQRDSSTQICESHPQICHHIEDTMTTIVRGIISPHYSLSLPVKHLGPIHYSPLRALNSSHTCVVRNAQGWPLSYGVHFAGPPDILIIIALSGQGGPKDH
jgi:hypothetical protein